MHTILGWGMSTCLLKTFLVLMPEVFQCWDQGPALTHHGPPSLPRGDPFYRIKTPEDALVGPRKRGERKGLPARARHSLYLLQ